MAAQHYLQADAELRLEWTPAHPERVMDMQEYTINDWGIYLADCHASGHLAPDHITKQVFTLSAAALIRQFFPPHLWYLANVEGIPRLIHPKHQYEDRLMDEYWKGRDGQAGHEALYKARRRT